MPDINANRKTKIQLLTKTTANSGDTALSNVDLDLGEPLVDNTTDGKQVIIGGTAHTSDQKNKANSTGNITLGASRNVVTNSSTGTANAVSDTDGVYINHIDNTLRSSHKVKGANTNISVTSTADTPFSINIGLNPNPKVTSIGVGSAADATTPRVTLEYDNTLNALKFVFPD